MQNRCFTLVSSILCSIAMAPGVAPAQSVSAPSASAVAATQVMATDALSVANTAAATAASAAQQAQAAAAAAAAAHAGAPHFAVMNYGNAQTCTWTKTMTQDAQGDVTGTQYAGGVDDHAAIQAAFNASGSFTNPPVTQVDGSYHNAAQGTVVFPDGQICRDLTGTIAVPPGVAIEGGGSEVNFTTTGHGFDLAYNFTLPGVGYGYGRYNDLVRNLNITGPGTATSLGKGLHLQLVNHGVIDHVTVSGFKYGISANQMQYTYVVHSGFTGNQVNCYVAMDPANLALPSIDNTFEATNCGGATRFGLWQQTGVGNRYADGDYGFAGSAAILLGGQLQPYVSKLALAGGSGCVAGGVNRVTFTDPQQLVAGEAFFLADASGVPVASSLTVTDGGMNIAAASFSVPSCTAPPTFTPTYRNDQTATGIAALGDYPGDNYGNGDTVFTNIKAEANISPDTGYFAIIGTPGTGKPTRGMLFQHPDFSNDNLGAGQFARQMRFFGTDNTVNYPNHTNDQDPALPKDTSALGHCGYRAVQNGPEVAVNFAYGSVNETNVAQNLCDAAGNQATGWNATYTAFGSDGSLLVPGLRVGGVALSSSAGNRLVSSGVWSFAAIGTSAATPPTYYAVPAGTADTAGNAIPGLLWADDKFLYHRNSTGHIVELPWNAFLFDKPADSGATGAYSNPISTQGLTVTGLEGSGNAYACLNASGQLFRSATACQ